MVLRSIRKAIEKKIDGEKEKAKEGRVARATSSLLRCGRMVEGKRGYSDCDEKDHSVLGQGIALAKDGEMEEHNRKQLTRFRQHERQVVNMRETGVSEWRSKRRRYADHDQGEQNALRREDRRCLLTSGGRKNEIYKAGDGRKEGLYCV